MIFRLLFFTLIGSIEESVAMTFSVFFFQKFPKARILNVFTKAKQNKNHYYSTIAPFHHNWSRERAKYEPVLLCSVPV